MLRNVISKVPDDQWNNDEYNNPNWQLVYHTLWAAKYYLAATPESFVLFTNAIEGAESLGGTQEWENSEADVVVEGFHTKEELLAFADEVEIDLAQHIEQFPLEGDAGFEWYPYSRLE